jgi:hypothetical protein
MHYDLNNIRLNFNTAETQNPSCCKLVPSRIQIAFILKENPSGSISYLLAECTRNHIRIPVAEPSLGRFGPEVKQPLWSLKLNSGNQHV